MGKDPAFLFYPGDYLRDTQCLSEKTQVSYDRIMCEHMRNICISQQQLKFFTKRLNEDELEELKMVLTESTSGYCIDWVVDSIEKRRNYSNSRRNNRLGKKKDMKTYDPHMEDEDEIEDVSKDKKVKHKYGEFKNVLLTDEEVGKLKTKLNSKYEYWIKTFSEGIKMKKYGYTDHYLAILKWVGRDEEKNNNIPVINQ